MSTAQQLGLIGNSVKVQSLPTASAETFGAGNRFYTLIGQQAGYITGHTYRTVVANDVYSWEDIDGGEETTGDYTVKVIDYDGTVLLDKKGNNGDSFDLPSAPSHEGLVFQEWSASCPITDGKVVIDNNNVMAGAVYTTASGQNEFDITLTKVIGLSVTLNMDGTKDWGDGTSDTETTHTYTAYGDYTIKCDGTTMSTSSNSGLFGQTSSINYYCTEARFATVTSIGNFAFYNCSSLTSVVITNGVTSINSGTFYACYSLTKYDFSQCTAVPALSSTNAFNNINGLAKIIVPDSLYDEWIAAANWSTYADYIYKASEVTQ